MCMLSMGRYVHVYVEYVEVCTCVCWVMERYVHVYVKHA